jgi:hypothetical protein
VPANAHGTPGADDRVRGLPLPVIRPDVLHADDARLRLSERTPRLPSREPRTDPVDAAVEVVRCEEGEVAAEISVALDHVVGVRRDVLLVAREDDEFVALRELRAARDRVEIVVGEESAPSQCRLSHAMKSRSQSWKRNGTPKSRYGR